MKKCYSCNMEKPLTEFYKHNKMADGYINKCKDCSRVDDRERWIERREDPMFVASERVRTREKYYRLYKGVQTNFHTHKRSSINYKLKYPEKELAKKASLQIECPKDFHKHHWSYNDEHFKDVIIIPCSLHYKLHRYINYDPKEKMYRTTENTLLDSRQLHEAFIEIIKQIY